MTPNILIFHSSWVTSMILQRTVHTLSIIALIIVSNFAFGQVAIGIDPSGYEPQCINENNELNSTDASGIWTLSNDDDVNSLTSATPSIPGYIRCLHITGSVSSLSALSALNLIYVENLYIDGTTDLRSLDGLETLSQIDILEISNNLILTDSSALQNVGAINEYVDVTPGQLCQPLIFPFLLYPELPKSMLFPDREVAYRYEDDNLIYGNLSLGGVNESCWNNAQATDDKIMSWLERVFEGALPVQKTGLVGDNRQKFTMGKGSVQMAAMSIFPDCRITDVAINDTDLSGGLLETDLGMHDCRNYYDPENDAESVIVIYDFGENLPPEAKLGKMNDGIFRPLNQSIIVGPYVVYKLWDDYDPEHLKGCSPPYVDYSDAYYGWDKAISLTVDHVCVRADQLDNDMRHGHIRDQLVLAVPGPESIAGPKSADAETYCACSRTRPNGVDGCWVLENNSDVQMLQQHDAPWIKRRTEEGVWDYWSGVVECLEVKESVTNLSLLRNRSEPLAFVRDLFIHDTVALKDLSGLETVSLIENIGIGSNDSLQNIKALENVTEINQLADVSPGTLCQDLKLPFVLHPNVDTYPDGQVFYKEAANMRSAIFGPAVINGVNQSCLENSGISDAELETRVRGLFDAIYPPQQYPQQIADYRQTFTTGKGILRISASDNVPECELKEATLIDANPNFPNAVAEFNFRIGDNCIPSNLNWVEDVLIVLDFGEDLPVDLRAGTIQDGQVQYLKRVKIVGPFLIYKLFDNVDATKGYPLDPFLYNAPYANIPPEEVDPFGWTWRKGCHNQVKYSLDGKNFDVDYLDACTGNDDRDQDPLHGILRDSFHLFLPTVEPGDDSNVDSDGDGINDSEDAFPRDGTEWLDTDSDGVGNNADTDDDGDGVADSEDAFPLDSAETLDTDSDGIGNNADTDDDGDGVFDINDAFPLDANESIDTDGDGIGNNADTDDDNDGYSDQHELEMGSDPLVPSDMPRSGGLSPALLRVISQGVIKDDGGD